MLFCSLYSILHSILYENGYYATIAIELERNIVKPKYRFIAFVGHLAVSGVIFVLYSVFPFLMLSRFQAIKARISVPKIRDDSCWIKKFQNLNGFCFEITFYYITPNIPL